MNSDPKSTMHTSCKDPPAKTSRAPINLFLKSKMRSPLEVSVMYIGVVFSVHGNSGCPMLPRGHFLSGLNAYL